MFVKRLHNKFWKTCTVHKLAVKPQTLPKFNAAVLQIIIIALVDHFRVLKKKNMQGIKTKGIQLCYSAAVVLRLC